MGWLLEKWGGYWEPPEPLGLSEDAEAPTEGDMSRGETKQGANPFIIQVPVCRVLPDLH